MGATFGHRKIVFIRKWNLDAGMLQGFCSSANKLNLLLAVKLVEQENVVQITAVPSVISDMLLRSNDLTKKIQIMSAGGAPLPATIPGELATKFPTSFL